MMPHSSSGVGSMNTANDGDFFHHREYLKLPNFHGDCIGITIGHQSGCRSVSRHTETAGVVNDDQVCTSFFNELRTDPGSCTGSYDGILLINSRLKAVSYFLSGVRIPFTSPRIWHLIRSYN